jgi:hypothetical protein
MDMAALVAWATTALGGAYLLTTWLVRGGMRQRKAGATRFPATLILGHFLLAASGLATWIAYVLTDIGVLAWAALAILLCVALLGFTMFLRWGSDPELADTAAHLASSGTAEGAASGQAAEGALYTPPPLSSRMGGAKPVAKGGTATAKASTEPERPAESHFPIAIVAAHGGFAVTTLILVLLAALGVGD